MNCTENMITEDISGGKERMMLPVVNEIDDQTPSDFGYTAVNIGGPNVNVRFDSPFYPGCNCNQWSCYKDTCQCLEQYGPFFDESSCLQIFCQQNTDYSRPVFECNSRCTCPESCLNRVVQKGLHLQLQVFKTKQKGWGLRTLEGIMKFTFVSEYAGELISISEAKKRARELTPETGNYIIVLREHSSSSQILRTHVDARFHGNASRFINHSCDPNLIMVPVRVDSIVPKLALFAARDIQVGEELSFDYSGEFSVWPCGGRGGSSQESRVFGDHKVKPMSCFCGSKNCKGILPFDSSLYSVDQTCSICS